MSKRDDTIVAESETHKEEQMIVEYDGKKVNSMVEKQNGNFMRK